MDRGSSESVSGHHAILFQIEDDLQLEGDNEDIIFRVKTLKIPLLPHYESSLMHNPGTRSESLNKPQENLGALYFLI